MRSTPRRSAAAALLAAMLGSAVAQAQPAPDAPPAGDPAAQPAPVDPAAQPAPADPADPAAPPADPGTQPLPPPPADPGPAPTYTAPTPPPGQPDSATSEEDKAEKRRPGAAWVRWRGSALNWSHDVTTTAVGVGRDNVGGEGEVYSQGFGGTFNFFIIDEKKFRLRGTTSLGFDVELTNGDTTTKREPRFRDIPITFATGGLTAWSSDDDEWALGFIPNITNIIPTSPVSQDRGILWTISPRLLTFLAFPILGNDSDHLKGVFSGISVRYDRTFTNANVPTNSSLAIPRTDPSGNTFLSDQISGNRLGDNTLRVGGFLFLEEKFGPSTLWLSGGPSWSVTFVPEFEDVDCVQIATGCAQVDTDTQAPTTRVNAGFGASVSYFPSAEFGVDLAYSNNTLQIGEDGRRRDIFYSPDATFSATLIVSVDAIYERIVDQPREDPLIIFGKNTPAPSQGPQQGPQQPGRVPTAFGTF